MINKIFQRIRDQYDKVSELYPEHPSLQHSAWVVREEFEEFLQEMKKKDYDIDLDRVTDELIDLVVAAIRMILDNKTYIKLT